MRPDGSTRRTTIWIVVLDNDVYVRSVNGERGYWYQAARESPDDVAIVLGERVIPVRAVPADDDEAIARVNAGLENKYRPGPSLDSMLRPYNLHTTLRLEPRPPATLPTRA